MSGALERWCHQSKQNREGGASLLEKTVISILEVLSLMILGDTKWWCMFSWLGNNSRAREEVGVGSHEGVGRSWTREGVGILWKTITERPSSQVIESNAAESTINDTSWALPLKVTMALVERGSVEWGGQGKSQLATFQSEAKIKCYHF